MQCQKSQHFTTVLWKSQIYLSEKCIVLQITHETLEGFRGSMMRAHTELPGIGEMNVNGAAIILKTAHTTQLT